MTSNELTQLSNHLWEAANILCGPVDAAEYSVLSRLWEAEETVHLRGGIIVVR